MVVPGRCQYDLFGRRRAGLEGMLRRRYIWKCVFATSSPRCPWVHRLDIDRSQHLVGCGCNESAGVPERPWLLAVLATGLPLNIGLETAKWHALRARGDKPWTTSLREVMVGATFALVTPNRTGDAVARVALLPANERPSGTQAWLLGAWAQAGWTLTLGTFAWWIYSADGQIYLPISERVQWTVLAVLAAGSVLVAPRHYPLTPTHQSVVESRWARSGRWTIRQLRSSVLSGLRYAVFHPVCSRPRRLGHRMGPDAAHHRRGLPETISTLHWPNSASGRRCSLPDATTRLAIAGVAGCSFPCLGGQPRAPRAHRRWSAIPTTPWLRCSRLES